MRETPTILVIFTGGTIGSTEVGGVKVVQQAAGAANQGPNRFALIREYNRRHPEAVRFETLELEPKILSENMTVAVWNRLAALLKTVDLEADSSPYAGVVITHGTDTLAYTAALLSVLLTHVKKPVVLVSSNEPLSSHAANGHKNFEDAVSFICAQAGRTSGVFAAYSYNLRDSVLYLGKHITQSQPFINRFGSYTGADFGRIENGCLTVDNVDSTQRRLGKGWSKTENILEMTGEMDNCVLLVTPYVGLDYSRLNLDNGVRAVLHSTYHSFSMCLDEKANGQYPPPSPTSAAHLFAQCQKRDIPLYFSSFDSDLMPYETTQYIMDKGAAFILNSSVELAYAKLLVGHNIQKERGLLGKALRDTLDLQLL